MGQQIHDSIARPKAPPAGRGEVPPIDGPADLDVVVLVELLVRSRALGVLRFLGPAPERRRRRVRRADREGGALLVVEARRMLDLANGSIREVNNQLAVGQLTGAELDEVSD